MKYFNQKVYRKSYLLEFSLNGSVESIAFSVPPQSEEFNYSQRIGETKTFGGSVFEDYGNDTAKITITGSTVNSQARLIYQGSNGDSVKTGEEEIFLIKNTIEKYGKIENIKGKKVKLYSLSDKDNKIWDVVINSFQIKRSKDNPFAYIYTLQCTSVPEAKKTIDGIISSKSKFSIPNWVSSYSKTIENACTQINNFCSTLEKGLGEFRKGKELLDSLSAALIPLQESVKRFFNVVNGYISAVGDYTNAATGLVGNYTSFATNVITETYKLGPDSVLEVARIVMNGGNDIFSQAVTVSNAVSELQDYTEGLEEKYISSNLVGQYETTASEIKNIWAKITHKIEESSNEIYAETSKLQNTVDYSVIPGSDTEDDKVVVISGFSEVKVKDGDTWDSLAETYYGDSSMASVIALYNGAKENNLEMGEDIAIPNITSSGSTNLANEVYNTPDVKDNYGTDIYVDENGDLLILQNDLATVRGISNLEQAINSRLRSNIDNRVRLTTYGIRSTVGSATEVESYIISSIKDTLNEEPRIKSVDKVSFNGNGDNLDISILYTDINNQKQLYGGTY